MDKVGDVITKQTWLKPVETALSGIAESLLAPLGRKVRNFLHGTWLGHPLHPILTDIPVGAWTAAAVLDTYELATGDKRFAPGADVAVGLGLAGAVGAAATGLTDFTAVFEKPRRVATVHAIFNIAATACYAVSLWQRRNGQRRAGLTTSLTGYALSFAGAYLGGHLVFNERIGVNHASEELPKKWTPLMRESDLPVRKLCKAEVEGVPVVAFRARERIVVMAEKCSHLGGPLAEGKFDGETITCPWHYSQFDLKGRVVNGPTTYPQPCFEVRVSDGQIQVRGPRGMVPNPY
jgi:nitrite reductase/ring-hydroxylating ferredoxin subunit